MTRFIFLILFALASTVSYAQFTDDFSDGDFSANPTWSGDTNNFDVNGAFQFQLNAPAVNDVMYASTPSQSINNAVWEFYVELGFNPSSSNFANVFVASDQADLKNPLNGYFVKIGGTNDEVSLYRQDGTTETMIIDGTNGRLNTSSVTLSVRVTRDQLGNWQLFSDTLGGTNYFLEGSITDNNHVSSAYFGVLCNYTSTRSTLFFYDDFNVTGNAFIDNIPPTIDSVVVVNSTNLDVYFNEPVDLTTSQTLTNYGVDNGIGNPNNAVRDVTDSSLVHLTFTTAFTNGQNYILSVSNVEDTASNPINIITHPFTYFVLVTPNSGDIIFNEIFADPTPQVGLPEEEFLELYNASANTFDLGSWQFINSTTLKQLPNFLLTPNSYVILCDVNDTALYSPYGDVIGVSAFTALSNGGDSLTLMYNNTDIIDVVAYTDAWYRDNVKKDGGYTLERINPVHPCSNANNWIASNHPDGGTPGTQNSVYNPTPDTQAPNIIGVNLLSTFTLRLSFNEVMDATSLSTATYAINNGISVSSATPSSNSENVVLTFSPALDSSLVYQVTVTGATDCSGNSLNPTTFSFGIGKAPQKFEIIITELFPDPSPTVGLPEQEFIELFNPTNKVIDLTNCWISDLTSMKQLNPGKIFPGEYVIVCKTTNENQFAPFGKVITISELPSLNNTDDIMTLYAPDTTIIHSVNYFDSWYKDDNKKDGGWTLEMIDPTNPCGEYDNWAASTQWFGGTPGAQNSVFAANPDNTLPRLLEANATSDSTVILTFSEIIDRDGLLAASYSINNGININNIVIIDNKNVQLDLANKLTFQIKYTVTVTGAYDCVGNVIGSNNFAIFALPEQGFSGDLVINEVLFNPFTGGSDFVELYNNSNKFIDLQNWSLANTDNNVVANLKPITTTPKLILPGEFVLLTKDANNIATEYINSKPETFIQMASLPTFSNSEGTVVLVNNLNLTVDSFYYEEDMHFSLLNSVKGVSLERIDYNRLTNDRTNWHSAAEEEGFATPGYENSQFQLANTDGGTITIDPKTFSPNNDGIDDVLNISYEFSTPGFVANVVIYDAKGRQIRNLIKSQLLGTKGTFSWDGINDNFEKARIGIYVIFIEVFDLEGNVKSFKETAVLAGRFD